MNQGYLVIYCTCPNQEVAERIARVLVVEGLAACVNILPDITSIYHWQGSLQCDPELLLIIKTREDTYSALENRICELHPYTVPEIIALPIFQGYSDYLKWIDTSLANLIPFTHQGKQGE